MFQARQESDAECLLGKGAEPSVRRAPYIEVKDGSVYIMRANLGTEYKTKAGKTFPCFFFVTTGHAISSMYGRRSNQSERRLWKRRHAAGVCLTRAMQMIKITTLKGNIWGGGKDGGETLQ